jgi:hypothetical protein
MTPPTLATIHYTITHEAEIVFECEKEEDAYGKTHTGRRYRWRGTTGRFCDSRTDFRLNTKS